MGILNFMLNCMKKVLKASGLVVFHFIINVSFFHCSDVQFKLLIVGDLGVGKTSLLLRYVVGIIGINSTVDSRYLEVEGTR